MKILCAAPAIPRFQWELKVLLTNLRQFTNAEVILLFTEHDFLIPIEFRRDWGCSVFVYPERPDCDYIPSVRPWLLWKYLAEDSIREQEVYFYIDSDVIFREWPDFTKMVFNSNIVYGSDCSGYLSLDYIKRCQKGAEIAEKMAEICGTTTEQMTGVPGIGAHLLLDRPTAAFWQRAYENSNELHRYLASVDTNLQKWTAEMWVQLWGWVREGVRPVAVSELEFCMATDDIFRWDEVKILHNAGVTVEKSHELFFKGQYVDYSPIGKNFDWVRRDKCSYRYVEAIKNVVQ